MRRITKRLTALLCAALMVATLWPAQVWAVEGADGGSAAALEELIVNDKPATDQETTPDGQPADGQTPAPTGDETPDAEEPEEGESADPQEPEQEPEQEVDGQDIDDTDDSDTLYKATLDPISHELEIEMFSAEEAAELPAPNLNVASSALTGSRSGDSYFNIISVARYGRAKLAKMSRGSVYLKLYDQLLDIAKTFTEGCTPLSTNKTVTYDEAWLVIAAFYSDYPELFWARPTFWFDENNLCTGLGLDYNNHAYNLENELPRFLAKADIILEGMPNGSDYEKELYLHDALIKKVTYTYSKLEEQNGYTTLVEGKGVCAGYAFALQYLLMRAGIQSYYVVGYAGENHAWNLAKIDGEWYYVDATWDDPVYNGSDDPYSPYHSYFNITTAMLQEDHTPSDIPYNVPLENCTATDAFYYKVNDTIVSTTDSGLVEKVADLLQRNGGRVYLYVTDNDPAEAINMWYNDNIHAICTAIQAETCAFGTSSFGREIVLWFAGEFLSKTPGELNGSSGIDIRDVELLYQYLTTGRPTITSVMTEAQFLDNADVNGDGSIDVYDLQLLYETVCGIN